MSIYGAMFSGVSGINANSQALGAIADNITNVNTIGYKATEVRFQTLVTSQASVNNYSPGGVQQRPFASVDVQGLFQSSTNATDLGISGDGFFVVNEDNTHNGSTGFRFTRAGAFSADESGYLRNTAGYYLQGYKTDASGQTVDSNNNSFEPDPTVFTNLETIRLNNIGGTADATENLTFGANLNAEASIGDTSNTTIQVFDSLGVAHNMSLVWTKATNNQWDLSINPPTQAASAVLTNSAGSVYASVGRLDFTTLPTEADSIEVTMNTSSGGTSITVTFDFTTTGAAVSGSAFVTIGSTASETANSLVAALNVVDAASGTATRFSPNSDDTARVDITQVSTTAVSANFTDIIIQASATSAIRQSGSGSFTIRDLDLALFENGDIRPIFKIPVATFANPNGLGTNTGNVYNQTDDSGLFFLRTAGTGGSGTVQSSVLESSTVDIAEEFTNMITTQRAYSASAKIISTADEMLDELVRIKR